jgi:hypothetical protein
MNKKNHSVDIVFMFVLFAVFAILSVMLVYMGSGVFEKITKNSEINSQKRTGISYIVNKVRASSESVYALEKDGYKYLVIDNKDGNISYSTIIYCRDNKLKEITIQKGDEFTNDFGDYIMDAKDFDFSIDNNLLKLSIKDTNGNISKTNIYLLESRQVKK